MGKVFGSSSYINHGGRIFPLMLALAACLFWASAAQAQAPFNSQYDPPPTAPPECGGAASGSSDGSSCDPATYTPTSYSPSAPPASYSPAAPAAPAAAPAALAAAPAAPAAPAATPAAPSGTTTETLLPTTGGLGLAPILLGAAIIAAAGIFTVRRRR